MPQKFTKRFIESLVPLKEQELYEWDTEIKGLGIRVFSSGRRTYFVQYRNQANRTRRQKIGIHGVITTDQARDEAKKILGNVCSGDDPSAKRKDVKKALLFSELAQEYLELYAKSSKKESSYKEDKRIITTLLLKRFGNHLISSLTTRDIQQLHSEFREKIYKANRTKALLRRMFNLAIKWGLVTHNPATEVKDYKEQKRRRWLNDEEMQRLWEALDSYSNQNRANLYRILLLTGARKNEILKATWDQFDLKKGVWTKPSHNTKQSRMEHLPLSSQALQLIKTIKEVNEDDLYLFPGKIPNQPIKEVKKAWATICKRAELKDFRIHDLRHTYASYLVSKGLSLSIVGKLLGHTQASTTQRYAHLADEPLRQATEIFGQKIQEIASKKNN